MNNIPFVGGLDVSRNVEKCRETSRNAEKCREMSSFVESAVWGDLTKENPVTSRKF